MAHAPGATFCHQYGWRELISGVLGHECPYAVAVDDAGRMRGLLPLVRVKSPLLGHYLISMPFLNYGGPLGGPEAVERLSEWALAEARRSRADLLELRSREPLESGLRTSHRKITVLLDLPADPDTLFSAFPSKLRSQIRRPLKEDGIEVRFGLEEREAFYQVFAHNMRDLGTPVLPQALFDGIARMFPHSALFGVVRRRGLPVAAGCGFFHRGEFEITWASSRKEFNHMGANMLLYWAFMREVIARGAPVFNFGRCTPGGGTHHFKSQWGGRDLPLPWAQWSPRDSCVAPSADRPAFKLAAAVWRRLPRQFANRVGPMLARRLP